MSVCVYGLRRVITMLFFQDISGYLSAEIYKETAVIDVIFPRNAGNRC